MRYLRFGTIELGISHNCQRSPSLRLNTPGVAPLMDQIGGDSERVTSFLPQPRSERPAPAHLS
jgi:hypothetical protein